jgi:hypothetical protein
LSYSAAGTLEKDKHICILEKMRFEGKLFLAAAEFFAWSSLKHLLGIGNTGLP